MSQEELPELDFLFVENPADLHQKYDIDENGLDEFVKKARKATLLDYGFMFVLQPALNFFCFRSFMVYFNNLSLSIYYLVSLPCFLITVLCYICLTVVVIVIYIFSNASQQFLVLRAKTLAIQIRRLGLFFDENFEKDLWELRECIQYLKAEAELKESEKLHLRRGKNQFERKYANEADKLKYSLLSFVTHYDKLRTFYDQRLSVHFLNMLFTGFLYPLYFYFDLDLLSKVSLFRFQTLTPTYTFPCFPGVCGLAVRVGFVLCRIWSDGGQ